MFTLKHQRNVTSYRMHCHYIILCSYNILGLGLQEYVEIGAFGTTLPLSSRCQWMRHSHGFWWMHSLDSVENSYLYELHKKFALLGAHRCQPRMVQPHRWTDQRERTEEGTGWIHSGTRSSHLHQPRWKRGQATHNLVSSPDLIQCVESNPRWGLFWVWDRDYA